MAESFSNLRDALAGRCAHLALGAAFAKYEPDSGAVNLFVVADGAGELGDFERAAREFAVENRARFVEKIFESLRGEHRVHVAGDGRFDIFEIVIGKLVGDHEFNGGGGRGLVERDFDGHDDIFAEARLFRIGVPGENREGAIDLLGEDHAGEFVWHGKRGERDFVFGGSAQVGGEPFRIAAEKDEFARAAIA